METNELNTVDASRLGSPYAGQEELLRDLMAWLDLHLYYYYSHHQWLGPSSEMKNLLGLVVTREEVAIERVLMISFSAVPVFASTMSLALIAQGIFMLIRLPVMNAR